MVNLKELLEVAPWSLGDHVVAEYLMFRGVYSVAYNEGVAVKSSILKDLPEHWLLTGAKYKKVKAPPYRNYEDLTQYLYFNRTKDFKDCSVALVVSHSSKPGVGIQNITEIISLFCCSDSEEATQEFEELLKKHKSRKRKQKEGSVYLFGMSHGEVHLNLTSTTIKSNLVPENYSKEVFDKHQFVCKNIVSPNTDLGKIAIYQGPPGTGKTYAIRNLISKIGDCFTVLISPGMLKQLADPSFVPLLIRMNNQNKPIIFILEDADEILTKRSKENIDSISNLLNFGDGILGSILDVRIVATTNAKIKEFDQAIMRPGRLLSFVEFEELSVEECAACIKNINPEIDQTKLPTEPKTLAECYVIARDGKEKGNKNGNTRNQKKNQTTKKLYH